MDQQLARERGLTKGVKKALLAVAVFKTLRYLAGYKRL